MNAFVVTRPTLVTGAGGFAGGHLVDQLVAEGVPVVAWYRPGGPARSEAGAEWEAVDLLNRQDVRRALARAQPSAVYHCAGSAHVGRSWDTTAMTCAVNVLGTHHVIESLRDEQIDARVLIPGSAMVYANVDHPLEEDDRLAPSSPYALSKLAQEMVGLGNPGGPATLIARAFNHIGPRQDPSFSASGFARRIAQIEAVAESGILVVGNLNTTRDLTDVRDTVRGYRAIMERGTPGRPYNVCSGRSIVIRDLVDQLIARARVPVTVVVDSSRFRPTDPALVVGSRDRISGELGWEPEIPLEQTLDDLLTFWRVQVAEHPREDRPPALHA